MKRFIHGLAWFWVSNVAALAQDSVNFLLLGDWGRETIDSRRAGQIAVAQGMGKVGNELKPMAVITLGDNFYEKGPLTSEAPIFREAFEEIYAAPSLQVPFWVSLGNHEYMGSVKGVLDYAAERKGSGRWTLPARYWSRKVELPGGGSAKFIFTDTSPFIRRYHAEGHSDAGQQDTQAQLAWLERELAETGITWRIVIGHHPAWSGGLHGDSADIQRELVPVLVRGKTDLYASGHDHHPEVIQRNGLLQLIAGNGSEVRGIRRRESAPYQGQHLGFASLSLKAKSFTIRQYDDAGAVRFSHSQER